MMVLLSFLLALSLVSELLAGPLPQRDALDRSEVRCSQGLQCKAKQHNPFSSSPCRSPPEGARTPNVTLSSTLHCSGRQRCSLQLVVSTSLILTEPVHGLTICVQAPGHTPRCEQVHFSKSSRKRMEGSLVKVTSQSVGVSPGQEARVRVHMVPELCGRGWTGTFHAPECSSGDLREKVPQCITGSLHYSLLQKESKLVVSVSDMLDDQDYRLRLCLESYVCSGTGAVALIKKEEAVKEVSLSFSRPVPCLCIEGWSAVMDAPRVRVCPFRDHTDQLWFGVTFDPMEQELSWQPACPVDVVVSLCQIGAEDVCEDLPHAAQTTRTSKVKFTKVDANPHLCVKFTTASGSWTKCPFKKTNLPLNPPHPNVPCPAPV
ncbi:unnamed protein product [Arctogadus glacialis]